MNDAEVFKKLYTENKGRQYTIHDTDISIQMLKKREAT